MNKHVFKSTRVSTHKIRRHSPNSTKNVFLNVPSASSATTFNPNSEITASVLQKIAIALLPFYRAIAFNRRFAQQWSEAVVSANLDQLRLLLASVAPFASRQGLGTNGIGYFISLEVGTFGDSYTNGVTIPPGSVQFYFPARIHRLVARDVLPLYTTLAVNQEYARALARAIRQHNQRLVHNLIRSRVRTRALQSVTIEEGGFALQFKYPSSKYVFRNLLTSDQFAFLEK
ncbi:hypothetical protein J2Z69_001269 [Paenibacillus shirakamiensis]|uniref:Uncharacterized protein n=1 Tax=Paenibacillus shirakamiensis TaxID=1265935 RepID=A0ABS4JEW4_9BACL|nr:hypothetical protein [Paenibacillus shirakamiensis]MBP2000250.1 hypothetical protein [Paenibacillus shirakamiensis]